MTSMSISPDLATAAATQTGAAPSTTAPGAFPALVDSLVGSLTAPTAPTAPVAPGPTAPVPGPATPVTAAVDGTAGCALSAVTVPSGAEEPTGQQDEQTAEEPAPLAPDEMASLLPTAWIPAAPALARTLAQPLDPAQRHGGTTGRLGEPGAPPTASRGVASGRLGERGPMPTPLRGEPTDRLGDSAPQPTPLRGVVPDPTAAASPSNPTLTPPAMAPVGAPTGGLPAGLSPEQVTTQVNAQVHGRVVPEVTRLVQSGNGTSRMTLHLNPGELGEVRVVMTVRDGSVRVRLAAHEQAHDALLQGAPELRRLLESHAATAEARIVVRELATAPAPAVREPSPQDPSQPQAGSTSFGERRESAAGREQGRGAGTPLEPIARDGMREATLLSRTADPRTSGRTAGLDVSM
ncbi:MAG: hypothetical protein F2667_13545 [Actinobacteria bacterium]|uniref:Unannotated protein n=1 Tax=freshwater metagenome TaxID=449393 RepID=A0A6J6S978_9ZZZZ|nr:hypothetical protein [Actinomycetota bacterium]